MSARTDEDFADFAAHESGDTLEFYEAEGLVLALWDQLHDLKLEQALLEHQTIPPSGPLPTAEEELNGLVKRLEKECLEARAAYLLRQNVIHDILITDPILKAVHSGANATPTERALHPLIDRRDVLGVAHTNQLATLESLRKDTNTASADRARIMEQNRGLVKMLLGVTEKRQQLRDDALRDPAFNAQLKEMQDEATVARKRWRLMRSVVSAVIASSGVDWAHDDKLQGLVLDDEDEAD